MGSDRSCWFWAYFFTIFLALKKGEGVSAALLAIFLRKKGSDSPFFIIRGSCNLDQVIIWITFVTDDSHPIFHLVEYPT